MNFSNEISLGNLIGITIMLLGGFLVFVHLSNDIDRTINELSEIRIMTIEHNNLDMHDGVRVGFSDVEIRLVNLENSIGNLEQEMRMMQEKLDRAVLLLESR